MIDLYLFCGDLKNMQSPLRKEIDSATAEIRAFLLRPSEKTAELAAGWREDFRRIYGDISAGLSGNSRLTRLAEACGGAEALQLLFFSTQTCYSLLIKILLESALRGLCGGEAASRTALILGGFTGRYGVSGYGGGGWYCWPVFELENGFAPVLDRIRAAAGRYESGSSSPAFRAEDSCDFIKQIYESMIPKELRHALGEYYTPDWLAEWIIRQAAADPGASIMDPTCGSGTFLCRAIAMKRRAGLSLEAILSTVRGLDLNPLAVLTAKTNYLLSVLDLLDSGRETVIPVYTADVLSLSAAGEASGPRDFCTAGHPADAVRDLLSRDGAAAGALEKADIIVGNPPWVNWEYLPEPYRAGSKHLWEAYGLFSARGPVRSFAKEDISALITYAAMDRFLRRGGVLSFVIRQAVFKSGQNGSGFRRFRIREGEAIQVLLVEDLSALRAFAAAGSAALLLARKGPETVYPVPYRLWRRREGAGLLAPDPCASLEEVLQALEGGTMGLLVELKPESGSGAALAAAVMELIERYGFGERSMFMSLDYTCLMPLIEKHPEWWIGFCLFGTSGDIDESIWRYDVDFLAVEEALVSGRLILQAREQSLPVYVWSVYDDERMRQYLEMGVSGIITDYPEDLRAVLDTYNALHPTGVIQEGKWFPIQEDGEIPVS